MDYKIAALGAQSAMLPFHQIGIDVFKTEAGNDLLLQVAQLIKSDYYLFFIDEDSLSGCMELLTMYDKHTAVTIIPVPGLEESEIGMGRIRDMVEKALGQNIL